MTRKKNMIVCIFIILCCSLQFSCRKIKEDSFERNSEKVVSGEKTQNGDMRSGDGKAESTVDKEQQWEKGFHLPIDDMERKQAETDCKKMMEQTLELYINSKKGNDSDIVIPSKTIHQMVAVLKQTGYPITASETYFNMKNYKKLETFLNSSMNGKSGEQVVYEVHTDGGIKRDKYIFDGTDMYVLSVKTSWNENNEPVNLYTTYSRIKEWKYSKKGWFCYELCVPEYPEVTEVVDGGCLLRVKPMSKEERGFSKKCVLGLGYQGNNLLCSNWDINHMENLDYNGLFEYFYEMKYHKRFHYKDYPNGIPKNQFENLIMEYLPITAEEIQKYATFSKKRQTYKWVKLGCGNYTPSYFGTSIPEVTDIRKNQDGTITLIVDAVCGMVLCDDAVITHELTVRFSESGDFQYLGNKVLDDGIKSIPDYQYRIRKKR